MFAGVAELALVFEVTMRNTTTVIEILSIHIKAGLKKGTKVMFKERGDQPYNHIAGDVVFIIDEKPHNIFIRRDNDLFIVEKISLLEALTGYTINWTTLDGRNLQILVDTVVTPGDEVRVPGEGMPIPRESRKKGDLIIMFEIGFPRMLTLDQKKGLRRTLRSRSKYGWLTKCVTPATSE